MIYDSYAVKEITENIYWNMNSAVHEIIREKESQYTPLSGRDSDRQTLAESFPNRDFYTKKECFEFLRAERTTSGLSYNEILNKSGIVNEGTQQAMVFDTGFHGFYPATGLTYAAINACYYISEDFSREPLLCLPETERDEYLNSISGIINNSDFTLKDRERELLALIREFPVKS